MLVWPKKLQSLLSVHIVSSSLDVVLFPCHRTEPECVGAVTCSSTPGTGELPQDWTYHHPVVGLQYMSGVE